jgi:hypothetical protein
MNTISRARLKEIVKEVMTEESEYQTFFKKALEKAGKSITQMSDDEKKEFFNKIDAAWSGRGEKNEELVGNQDKLDVDNDGEIEASDLAALRAGDKKEESVNEIEYKDAVEKFNVDLMKNSQVERIAQFHKKSIKDVVKALQPYVKVLRYNDKSVKVISIDFRDTNSDVKVHVSQTYKQNESVKESLSSDVAKHMGSIHKGFKKVEDDGVMVYDSPTNAKKAADFLNSKKIAASSNGKYVYLESVNEEVQNWDVVHNVFVKFLKANTKELEKRVLAKDADATKKAIKSIVSGLTNAQKNLKLESINEEFKHIISVDTPTQIVSKPIAAQIEKLAKSGVRSKEIGLKMGFIGNQKLATDAFQKLKNQIYFKLGKNESMNEGRYDADLDKIKAAVEKASSFMSVGSELKKIGVKYDFSTGMMPIYTIKVPGNTIGIVNAKYAAGAEREVKGIAIGLMEGTAFINNKQI